MKTNLERIKDIAIRLLYIKPTVNEKFPFIVSHPFFTNPCIPFKVSDGYELLNIMDDKNFHKVCKQYEKVINELDNLFTLFMMANKPYMPCLWAFTNKYIGEKDFEEILRIVWQHTEFPNNDKNYSVTKFSKDFSKSKICYLMSEEELNIFNNFPKTVTIYRGCYSTYKKALSWTLSKEKAIWFSKRFSKNGKVYQATINKEDILAYFDGDEQEIIPNIKNIKNLEQIL